MMRQALVLFGLVPLALGLFGASNHPATAGLWWGLVLAGGVVTVAYMFSMQHEGAHQGESADFWLAWEARSRRRGLFLALAGNVAAGCVLVVGLVSGEGQVSAFALAPLVLAAVLLSLLWGKVP